MSYAVFFRILWGDTFKPTTWDLGYLAYLCPTCMRGCTFKKENRPTAIPTAPIIW